MEKANQTHAVQKSQQQEGESASSQGNQWHRVRGFIPQGPTMRVDEDGRVWLKTQWRVWTKHSGERDDMCCTPFSMRANQIQRKKDLATPERPKLGKEQILFEREMGSIYSTRWFSREAEKYQSIPSTWGNYSHGHVLPAKYAFFFLGVGAVWNNLLSSCAIRRIMKIQKASLTI